jgi:histidine triad (HIT) family protein
MTDTPFSRIVRGQAPADIVYQDEDVTAFRDIRPAAPVHVLIVPNKVLRTLNDAEPEDQLLLGKLLLTARRLARELGVAESGYRIVINCNAHGGQSVYHLHLHLLGGRAMSWPSG